MRRSKTDKIAKKRRENLDNLKNNNLCIVTQEPFSISFERSEIISQSKKIWRNQINEPVMKKNLKNSRNGRFSHLSGESLYQKNKLC